jgi:ribosomal protein L11 methyltransferase
LPYWQIHFRVYGEGSGALSDALIELGALAVTMRNGGSDDFDEAGYPERPNWPSTDVTGMFPEAADTVQLERAVVSAFPECTFLESTPLEDEDWERSWLSDFEPIRAGRRLWIVPSWLSPPDESAVNLEVDPGLAFGTGSHPTTALCLSWLDRNPPAGLDVVDFGCGSGILALAALKLGASRAWGIDVDPRALGTSRENAQRNEVADRYSACSPGNMPEGLQGHLVMANILASVLVDLGDELRSLVCDDGVILLSGILTRQSARVRQRFDHWFEFSEERSGEWCLLIGVKR